MANPALANKIYTLLLFFGAHLSFMNKKPQQLSALATLALGISFLASSGLEAVAQKVPTSQFAAKSNKYPQDAVAKYMANCTAVASKQLPKEAKNLAKDLCVCTIDRFQAKYTYQQYTKLTQEAKEEVGYACFEKYLYEE